MNIAQYSTTLNLQYLPLKFAVLMDGNFKIFSIFTAVIWVNFYLISKSFLQKIPLIPSRSKLIKMSHLSKFKLAIMFAFPNIYSSKTLHAGHRFLEFPNQYISPDSKGFGIAKQSIVMNHAETVLQPDLLKNFQLYKPVQVDKEKIRFRHSKRHSNKAVIFPRQENLMRLRLFRFDRYTEAKFFVEIIRLPKKTIMRADIVLPQQKLMIQKVLFKIQNTINIEQFYQNCLHIKYRIKLHSNLYFLQFQEQLIQIPTNEHKKQILYTKY